MEVKLLACAPTSEGQQARTWAAVRLAAQEPTG